ncbi:MAG TPA: hypothetical protein VF889_06800, partial [Bacteroidota bacterium]
MDRPVRIIVGIDDNNQHMHYSEALQKRIHFGANIMYRLADLSRYDWIRQVEDVDLIFWHPRSMGSTPPCHFKEKIFFLERYLGKTVCPGYDS